MITRRNELPYDGTNDEQNDLCTSDEHVKKLYRLKDSLHAQKWGKTELQFFSIEQKILDSYMYVMFL